MNAQVHPSMDTDTITEEADIYSDGVSVWVNNADCCLGRFAMFGIDVHRAYNPQKSHDLECLHCTHERTTEADWETFKQKMLEHHKVVVSEDHKPQRFRRAV